MSRPPVQSPRDLLNRWPDGVTKKGVDPAWGRKALDLAFLVKEIQARIDQDGIRYDRLAFGAGISKSTLNRFLTGQSWPTLYVVTELSWLLRYPELWEDMGARVRVGLNRAGRDD